MTQQKTFVYLLPLIAVLTWAGNVIAGKIAVGQIEAWSLSLYRWALAFILLTPFVLPKVWKNRHAIAPFLPKLAVLGALGMVVYQGLAYQSAYTTTATNIGILNAMIPMFTLLIATVVLKEKPTLFALIGVCLSIIGIGILIGKGNPLTIFAGNFHSGDMMMIVAVASYALYGVLTRYWQLKLDLFSNIYLQVLFAILCHVPILLFTGLSPLTAHNIGLVVYAGIFPSLIAPLVWTKSIQQIGASQTSIFLNLMPIFTAVIAVLYLHESWQMYHTIGTLLILGGVVMAQVKVRKKAD